MSAVRKWKYIHLNCFISHGIRFYLIMTTINIYPTSICKWEISLAPPPGPHPKVKPSVWYMCARCKGGFHQ